MKRVAQAQHLLHETLSAASRATFISFAEHLFRPRQRIARADSASNANQRAIERRVRAFYAFWGKPDDAMKNRALMRFYTSRRLNRWLYSSAYEDYDSDYFLQAQDYDDDWNQAHVRDARVSGNTARLLATLGSPKPANKGLGEQKLRLKMVKEDGLWKIDAVALLDR